MLSVHFLAKMVVINVIGTLIFVREHLRCQQRTKGKKEENCLQLLCVFVGFSVQAATVNVV